MWYVECEHCAQAKLKILMVSYSPYGMLLSTMITCFITKIRLVALNVFIVDSSMLGLTYEICFKTTGTRDRNILSLYSLAYN